MPSSESLTKLHESLSLKLNEKIRKGEGLTLQELQPLLLLQDRIEGGSRVDLLSARLEACESAISQLAAELQMRRGGGKALQQPILS